MKTEIFWNFSMKLFNPYLNFKNLIVEGPEHLYYICPFICPCVCLSACHACGWDFNKNQECKETDLFMIFELMYFKIFNSSLRIRNKIVFLWFYTWLFKEMVWVSNDFNRYMLFRIKECLWIMAAPLYSSWVKSIKIVCELEHKIH